MAAFRASTAVTRSASPTASPARRASRRCSATAWISSRRSPPISTAPAGKKPRTCRAPSPSPMRRESMRLTTRLMQVASWLLVQRAVNEGDMDPAQAEAEKHKVRLCPQDVASGPGRLRPVAAAAAGADGPVAAPAEPHHLPRPVDPPAGRGRARPAGRRGQRVRPPARAHPPGLPRPISLSRPAIPA